MELRHLRYFVSVADARNMAVAARQLRVAQSALSRQIQDLEREIGTDLFERHSRGLRLTGAGAAFLARARSVLAAADEAVTTARAVARGEQGVLRLAPPDVSAWLDLVAEAVERFRIAHPSAAVVVAPLPWMDHTAAVQSGHIDVGVTFGMDGDLPDAVTAETLGFEPIDAALLPARHPLAASHEVTLDGLRDLPLALGDREVIGGLHDMTLTVLRAAGYEPRVIGGMSTFAALAQLVATGGAWALVASSLAASAPTGTVIRPVRGIAGAGQLSVFAIRRRDSADPLAAAFLALLRAVRDDHSARRQASGGAP